MQFHVANMTCGGCARSVTKALHAVDPAADVTADLDSKTVTVRSTAPRDALSAALAGAGYTPA